MWGEKQQSRIWPYSLKKLQCSNLKNTMKFLMYIKMHTSLLIPESCSAEIFAKKLSCLLPGKFADCHLFQETALFCVIISLHVQCRNNIFPLMQMFTFISIRLLKHTTLNLDVPAVSFCPHFFNFFFK